MANRQGGTVVKTRTSDTAGKSAVVTYPEAPSPVTYSDLSADEYAALCRAQDHGKVVDVDADEGNNVTAVSVR